jgi:hypothetical protein
MNRDAKQIALSTLIFLIGYGGLLHISGIRADFCETNFYANLLEAQDYLYGRQAPSALVGTSLSMTLLPQYFAEAGSDTRNLGLAGGKAVTGLRLLDKRGSRPEFVLIEQNNISGAPGMNDQEILEAVDGFSFRIARWIPVARTQARLSSIVYTVIKKRKDAKITGGITLPLVTAPQETTPERARTREALLPADFSDIAREVAERIRALEAQGVKIGIYRLPAGALDARLHPNKATLDSLLVDYLQLPTLDLRVEMTKRNIPIRYTDNLHLQVEPARAASQILAEWMQNDLQAR